MRLFELSIQPSLLFHATPYSMAIDIVKSGKLLGKTTQLINSIRSSNEPQHTGMYWDYFRTDPQLAYKMKGGQRVKGISFTRNWDFARKWAPIIFVFDRAMLSHRNRIIPHDHVNYGIFDYTEILPADLHNQSEEFVIGDIDLSMLISITPSNAITANDVKNARDSFAPEEFAQNIEQYIANHPKFLKWIPRDTVRWNTWERSYRQDDD